MRMPTVMQHDFARVPAPQVQRSMFNRSRGHKTTFNAGFLIPIYVDEILPGDTKNLRAQFFARLSTLLFPIMDNLYLDSFWFFVPSRLLWANFEKFHGARTNPSDSTDFLIPGLTGAPMNFVQGSIHDYMGLPTKVDFDTDDVISALPFRAYNLIWNEWFRDENLQDSALVNQGDGPDVFDEYELLRRGKRHDYLTSSLPFPQKGDSVLLPLGDSAPVIGNGQTMGLIDGASLGYGVYVPTTGNAALLGSTTVYGAPVGTDTTALVGDFANADSLGLTSDPAASGMIADLSAATAATINSIREAAAFQQVLERDARGGTRYVEMLLMHFGVQAPDFRLQRPEYLGGSSDRMSIVSVPQTSNTGATGTPQGNLAGYGISQGRSGFAKSFVEHGYVIGLVNVRADISYQQGVQRFWTRRTRFDFYLPTLANLGEQSVLNREIFYANGGTDSQVVFGYQERWSEYRHANSMVTGLFRSNATGTLEAWHLALDFATQPQLDEVFIEDDPPVTRVLAVTTEPHVILDSFFDVKHARPMPVYSIPGLRRF